MLRLVVARLWADWRRSLATFLAVLFAVTSFVVLTGATTTQRVEALDVAADSWRSSVDILVRPANSRTEIERETGWVRPNFLQDIYGGITVAQWEQIAALPGVEVAAPISMVGMVWAPTSVQVDLADFVAPAGEQLLRLHFQTLSRGQVLPARSAYVYITDNPLEPPLLSQWVTPAGTQWELFESSGPVELIAGEPTFPCIPLQISQIPDPHGSGLPPFNDHPNSPFDPGAWDSFCISRQQLGGSGFVVELPYVFPLTVVAADPSAEASLLGLDSAIVAGRYFQETDHFAVQTRPNFRSIWGADGELVWLSEEPTVTALISDLAPAADVELRAEISELSPETIDSLRSFNPTPVPGRVGRSDQLAVIAAANPIANLGQITVPFNKVYATMLASLELTSDTPGLLRSCELVRIGHVGMEFSRIGASDLSQSDAMMPDATNQLVALPAIPQDLRGLTTTNMTACPQLAGFHPVVGTVTATPYRRLTRMFPFYPEQNRTQGAFEVVGVFDPLGTLAATSQRGVPLPLETYYTPVATISDAASRAAVGRAELLPNLSPMDYLIPDISLVFPLDQIEFASTRFFPASELNLAPISAVRVRVAGVTGWDEISQFRVATVADAISELTGLDVDTTIGAGLVAQDVTLRGFGASGGNGEGAGGAQGINGAGDGVGWDNDYDAQGLLGAGGGVGGDDGGGGQPQGDLHIVEYWTRLGVVLDIVEQVDRKSVLLFGLILASGSLTIAAVAAAAAAAQRKDLGTLSAIGYRPGRLWAFLMAQQGLLGTVAGMLGALLAWPIGRWMGINIDGGRALLAIPIATAVTLLASVPSAITAARTVPIKLLTPPVHASRRALPVRNPVALGAVTITRRPLRLVRAAIAIAIAVIGLSVLLVIAWTFQGAVAGSLLGEELILQVRAADIAAGVILTILGLVCLVMTLRFAHLEDQRDWAVLSAVGWGPSRITNAVLAQGAVVGIVGAVLGVAGAFGITSGIIGHASTAYLLPIGIVAAGVALACIATTLIPAAILKRLALARALTQE